MTPTPYPPLVGLVVYVVSGMVPEASSSGVFRAVIWFILAGDAPRTREMIYRDVNRTSAESFFKSIEDLHRTDLRSRMGEISVPIMVQTIIDRCIQMQGAGGLTSDYFMAEAFNYARWCRQADGPDQVHMMALGKQVINAYAD